jgi:hypothetical protein
MYARPLPDDARKTQTMPRKNAKQDRRRSAAKLKLRVTARARPPARGRDLGDVRLQFLLGASALPR